VLLAEMMTHSNGSDVERDAPTTVTFSTEAGPEDGSTPSTDAVKRNVGRDAIPACSTGVPSPVSTVTVAAPAPCGHKGVSQMMVAGDSTVAAGEVSLSPPCDVKMQKTGTFPNPPPAMRITEPPTDGP
jgi:hypothetical protein